jgi:NADPH:quinone reductase-like Zn-dependent oxidoreductase
MRAVVLREFGPAAGLAVDRVPDPEPGPGQALVAVELASITFVETQVRAARPPHPAMAPALPFVLGNGVDDFGVTLVRSERLPAERQTELSARALALAAAGRLRPVVGQTFALDRAGDAHAAIESRATIGKTLLCV